MSPHHSLAIRSLSLPAALLMSFGCGTSDGRAASMTRPGPTAEAAADASVETTHDTCTEEPIGVDALARIDRLPFLRRAAHARAFTSGDRQEARGNMDYNQYLASSDGENTLFDAIGPGLITRFWRAHIPTPGGEYRFYFDGASEPSLVFDAEALWLAKLEPFTPPLTLDYTRTSGGAVTHLPIAFSRSLRITDVRPPEKDYYQIDYLALPERALTSGISSGPAVERAEELLQRVGENPNRSASDSELAGELKKLAPGASAVVATLEGPAQIVGLELALDPAPSDAARAAFAQARLQITWDDAPEPAVDAPLGMFFAHGNGLRDDLRTLLLGNRPAGAGPERFYAYFPMPFQRSARVAVSAGAEALGRLRYAIHHRPFRDDFAQVGYFHARHVDAAASAAPLELVTLRESAGHYVGLVFVPNAKADLEGDPNFYVDGMVSPFSVGTGSEDYFNGGWYYNQGSFVTPLHGAILATEAPDGSNRISQFRIHPGDPIPFASAFRLTWEMGVGAQAVAYYYARSEPLQRRSDALDVGTDEDEQRHAYVVDGASTAVELSAPLLDETLADRGRLLSRGAVSTFVVQTDPDNDGVTLRRRFDVQTGPQRALVRVQGEVAGTWQSLQLGAADARWVEDEFYIPARLSQGASSLTISLTVESESFNEYAYQVFSRRRLRPSCP